MKASSSSSSFEAAKTTPLRTVVVLVTLEGVTDGVADGTADGSVVVGLRLVGTEVPGEAVGIDVAGDRVGRAVGVGVVGALLGAIVGATVVGKAVVGSLDGAALGSRVGQPLQVNVHASANDRSSAHRSRRFAVPAQDSEGA